MEKQIEILAPAGSYESMRAAMNAGCDAVYMGGSRFGARAFAENPDEDLLLKAIDEAHLRNKRLYLTVNTLIKENEIRDLYEYLEKYYLAGLDAVIVQDVGVMKFIHEHFPKLPIHASTQTTITMAQGANLLKSMGVTRLVTARELSFKEIKHIRDNTDMEIETFVHGALCYCYSGQCLMSSMIGGRSGNRGRCAQPCRMPYHFFSGKNKISSDKEPYLLSPKDINTISLIPDLIDAGVESFKIEGRMKSPEYAAGVSYLYRKYVDIYMEEGREKFQECLQSKEFNKDMLDLMDLYNRGGFSEGYGKLYHGKSMMSTVRPNHSGVVIGEVIGVHKGYVNIRLNEDINAQDILEIRNINNEPVYEFTMKDNRDKFETLKANVGYISIDNKGKIKGKKPNQRQKISIGDLVYRTRNNNLINTLQDKYIKKDEKLPIKGYLLAKLGEKLRLTLYYNNCHVTAHHNIVEPAIKQPMTKEKLQASIDKLGDSMFYFQELDMEADDDIFVPVSWLNEIRREAILALSHKVIESYRRTGDDGVADRSQDGYSFNKDKVRNFDVESDNRVRNTDNIKLGHTRIRVSVLTKEQFDLALSYKEISSIYLDYDNFSLEQIIEMSKIGSNHGKELYVLLPHICRPVTYMKLEKDISTIIKEDTITGFIVKNNEEIELLHRIYESTGLKKNIRLNHNMYIFNKEAKEFWKDQGINDFTAPLELNKHELKELGLGDCEIIVYGYMPVMVSVQCLYASTDGCSKCQAGESRSDYLLDRLGKKFYVRTNCSSCYNIIYNGQRLSLLGQTEAIKKMQPNGIRLDFTYETIDEMKMVLEAYIGGFVYGRTEFLKFDNITRGHFNRGVE